MSPLNQVCILVTEWHEHVFFLVTIQKTFICIFFADFFLASQSVYNYGSIW